MLVCQRLRQDTPRDGEKLPSKKLERSGGMGLRLPRLLHRRMVLLFLDILLIAASYAGAYVLRLGGEGLSRH